MNTSDAEAKSTVQQKHTNTQTHCHLLSALMQSQVHPNSTKCAVFVSINVIIWFALNICINECIARDVEHIKMQVRTMDPVIYTYTTIPVCAVDTVENSKMEPVTHSIIPGG